MHTYVCISIITLTAFGCRRDDGTSLRPSPRPPDFEAHDLCAMDYANWTHKLVKSVGLKWWKMAVPIAFLVSPRSEPGTFA
jgi:hypothetical protein